MFCSTCSIHKANKYSLPDNDLIIYGYRPKYTIYQCFMSQFTMHNQTFNIWTVLISIIINCSFGIYALLKIDFNPRLITAFCFGRAITYLFSWIYHTFNAIDLKYSNQLIKLDYIGCLLTVYVHGSTVVYLDFYNLDFYNLDFYNYINYFSIILLICATPFFMIEKLLDEKFRYTRVAFLVIPSLSYMLPIIIKSVFLFETVYVWFYLAYLIEFTGMFLFTTKLPESVICSNKTFLNTRFIHTYLNSHILWHICNIFYDISLTIFCYKLFILYQTTK